MRIALISDIHGNLVSLDTVLADIHREGADQIICLGDVPMFGPQPCQVMARLQALDCPCVMGNHDLELLNPGSAQEDFNEPAEVVEWMEWCAGQLSLADFDYLRSFQPSIRVPLDARTTLLCFHGSPRSHKDSILATTPAAELDEMLAGPALSAAAGLVATVMAGGHTHVQMLRRYKSALIVNVGSVGFPVERIPFEGSPRFMPWAEYAIVNWANGNLGVELRRVAIALDAVKQAALDSDMPNDAFWVEQWITPTIG